MPSAREIHVQEVPSGKARDFVRAVHYSGKVVANSQLHLGVFLNGAMLGVMQFGPPMDKVRTPRLVSGTPPNGMIELNRMAFSEDLPRNSESRALGVALRMIKKRAPHIQWVLSFADGCQCGDGAIYRAAGFALTAIKKNTSMLRMRDGSVVAKKSLDDRVLLGADGKKTWGSTAAKRAGDATPLVGFQLRYVYFLNPTARQRLTVPELPFSAIRDAGASMYRGQRGVSSGEPRPPSLEGVRPDHAAPSTHNTGGKAERVSG